MKKIIFLACIISTSLFSCAQKTIVKDANAEPRTLQASFHAIKVSGGIDLYLSQYETESIAVSAAEDKYIDAIKTVVENGVLKIYYEGTSGWNMGNRKMKAYVSFKNLNQVQASGASDVTVAGSISVPVLRLDLSGASDFKGALNITDLTLKISGASDVKVNGSATNIIIESSGASDVKAYDLITENCTAKASGASDINITVNKEMNVTASGASDVFYKGTCVIKSISSSGASTVSRKD
jgi:hypothetical protein